MSDLASATANLCSQAAEALPPGPLAGRAGALGARLGGPLRIAVAGRVKAGKSTLLNALVGQRVAATDASECTRLVTWYEHGLGYGAQAVLLDGSLRPVRFERDETQMQLHLDDTPLDHVERLQVSVPSRTLTTTTLIDTPGLASIDGERSRRTARFLDATEQGGLPVDAVIYLMRHVHQQDVAFLDAFMDRSVAGTSPVNAIAVLSRADEIGAGRLDALTSAERVAERYRANEQVRTLVSAVVPVAGLLAETAATLREDEAAHLRHLATLPSDEQSELLLTADRFCDPARTDLTVEVRRSLLERLGVFGVRYCLDLMSRGLVTTAAELAGALETRSGIGELRALLDGHFAPRARVLQARTVLAGLRALAVRCRAEAPGQAAWLASEVERIEASSPELQRLRLLHLVMSGSTRLTTPEREEANELASSAQSDCGQGEVITAIGRWRSRAEDPLADPLTREAAELTARLYESLFMAL